MCSGAKLHNLRMSNHMHYSDLSSKTKLPANVLKGMEQDYIPMCATDIFILANALDMPYIDLCSTWEEVKDCLEFKLNELFEIKSPAELKRILKLKFYVPNHTNKTSDEYTLKTLYNMCIYFHKDLLGVKISMYKLSERLGITVSQDSIKLSTLCNIAFCKGLSLSYVLGGYK